MFFMASLAIINNKKYDLAFVRLIRNDFSLFLFLGLYCLYAL